MGIIKNLKDKAKNKAKKSMGKIAKGIGLKMLSATIPFLIPMLLIGLGGLLIMGLIDYAVEIFTAKNNPELIYEALEIENVSELITIKGDEQNGYYLDFIDGIDDKLKDIIKKNNESAEYHNIPNDINFLKKLLKAEVYTEFPDLKGTIASDSKDGFQGAVTIRRVTPNKSPRGNEKYRTG